MRLVTEEALANAATHFRVLREQLGGYRTEMLDHAVAGWCLRNYVILTEFPQLLGESGLTEPEFFWSRYYWLARFARVWSAVAGNDAGLEQQVLKFVEYSPHGLDGYQEVNVAAEVAAAEQLRAAGVL